MSKAEHEKKIQKAQLNKIKKGEKLRNDKKIEYQIIEDEHRDILLERQLKIKEAKRLHEIAIKKVEEQMKMKRDFNR